MKGRVKTLNIFLKVLKYVALGGRLSGKHLALHTGSPMPDVDVHKLNGTVLGSTKSLTNTDLSSLQKDFFFLRKKIICKYLIFATRLVELARLQNPGQETEGEARLLLHFLSRHRSSDQHSPADI